MQNTQLPSKKKMLLDFLYNKRQKALSNQRLSKNPDEEGMYLAECVAYNEVILFLVDEPCMQWPL